MVYFLSGFWGLLEIIFFYLFWGAYLPAKRTRRQEVISISLFWVIFTLTIIFLGDPHMLKITLTSAEFFLLSRYLYRGAWYQHFVFVFLGYIINGSIDTLLLYSICILLDISYTEFVWMKLLYVVTVTISKLLSIFLGWIIRKFRRAPQNHAIQRKWLLLSLLFPGVSMFMLSVVFAGFQDSEFLSTGAVIFSAFLAIANIAILYLINTMEKTTAQMQEQALLRQQMEIQTDSIVALERSYRNQRQATHEFKNQLQTIYGLLDGGKVAEAQTYIQHLQGIQTTRIFTVNSRHPIVDAILNRKYQTAKDHGIDFQIQVNDLSRLSIGTNELVVLLSNLLDNAIEGCCRVQDNRAIQCTILMDEMLFLSVRNTSVPVTILGDTIPTSKMPKEEHGFGLSRIQLILKGLGAEYTFTYENGWFEFVAEIPEQITRGDRQTSSMEELR